MDTERDEYCTDMLDHLSEHNDCHRQRFPSKNLKDAVLQVIKEEDEEEEIKRNINNITCGT